MNNPIHTRDMTRKDLSAVSEILESTGLFPSELAAGMAEPYLSGAAPHIWIAAHDGSCVLGFAYCEPERMTDGAYNLLAIAVDPARQGAGAGQRIVAGVEARVRERGGRILLVETSSLPQYQRTRSFYGQLGFSREAKIRDYYAQGEDKIVFWKQL